MAMPPPPPPPPHESRFRLIREAELGGLDLRRLMAGPASAMGGGARLQHGGLLVRGHPVPSAATAPPDLQSLQYMARGGHTANSLHSLRNNLRWFMGGAVAGRHWPESEQVFSMPMMMSSAACALQPQIGSAFQRVVRSRSENLLPPYSPILPSPAFHPEEKRACSTFKEEVYFDNAEDSPDSPDDIKDTNQLLLESLKAPESELLPLPLKKRKPRFADAKMNDLSCERKSNEYPVSHDHGNECQPTDVPARCVKESCQKCVEMSKAEEEWSLDGRFTSWTAVQVQLWLWKTLRDSQNAILCNSACQVLQSIKDYDGKSLATFDREQWQLKLSESGVPPDSVWLLVCKRMEIDSTLKPYNYCDFAQQREGGKSSRMKLSPASKTPKLNVVKKANKPRRRRDKCVGQLWEFVFHLLEDKQTNPSVVCWEDKEKLLFRIVNTEEIARRWGAHKGNNNMTYANMSRTMRYYREGNGAFVRNERKRVYGFGPKADFARLQAKTARNLSQ